MGDRVRTEAPKLRAGETIRRADGSRWVVERVGASSATIRCTVASARQVGTRRVDFRDGRSIDVPVYGPGAKPGERLEVSPRSQSERVRDDESPAP